MSEHHTTTPGTHDAGSYEIRLEGRLDPHWTTWFDGLTVSQSTDQTTLLTGHVADQAALHSLLQRVRDLGLPLISVTRVENDPNTKGNRP